MAETSFLSSLTHFLNKDVFYENAIVFVTMLSLLKLDSFLEDQVMATFISQLQEVVSRCSKW